MSTDDEMRERVTIHKNSRNQNWQTFEGYRDLDKVIEETKCQYIILECITTMITNLMFDKYIDFDNLSKEYIQSLEGSITDQVTRIITKSKEFNKNLVIITNEVGFGLVSEYKLGRIFTDISGRINQLIGRLCDEGYMLLMMRVKRGKKVYSHGLLAQLLEKEDLK